MSQYATAAELSKFGLPSASTADLDSADIDAQLEAASAEIDSVLIGKGYGVPLTVWGNDITSCCARIAAWSVLTNLRGVNPSDPGHAGVRMSCEDARDWLKQVAKGYATPTGTTPSRARTAVATVFSPNGSGSTSTRGW